MAGIEWSDIISSTMKTPSELYVDGGSDMSFAVRARIYWARDVMLVV